LIVLLKVLAPLKTDEIVSDDEFRRIERGTQNGGWRVWTAGLLLISGKRGEAAAFLEKDRDLDAQLRQSITMATFERNLMPNL
jgi:hypothetical protein